MTDATISQAVELTEICWRELDAAGWFRSWDRVSGRIAAQQDIAVDLIEDAADEYRDQTGIEPTLCTVRHARALLLAQCDAWLAREAAALATELAAEEPERQMLRFFGDKP